MSGSRHRWWRMTAGWMKTLENTRTWLSRLTYQSIWSQTLKWWSRQIWFNGLDVKGKLRGQNQIGVRTETEALPGQTIEKWGRILIAWIRWECGNSRQRCNKVDLTEWNTEGRETHVKLVWVEQKIKGDGQLQVLDSTCNDRNVKIRQETAIKILNRNKSWQQKQNVKHRSLMIM